ncbi:MAG TPA: ATP-binding protein, partial [Chloroflexaceae bacterium]|nr:ATP-binding protein [Chloroflexaceae bacterium]
IEGRRTQLVAQELLRARQSAQATELLAAERIRSATLLLELIAEHPGAAAPTALSQMRAYLRDTRDNTFFDLLTVVDAGGRVLVQDGDRTLWRPDGGTNPRSSWGTPDEGLVVEVRAPVATGETSSGTLVGSFRLDRSLITYVRATTDLEQSLLRDGRLVATSLAARVESPGPLVTADPDVPVELMVAGSRYLGLTTPLRDPAGNRLATLEVLVPLTTLRSAQQQATVVIIGALLLAVTLASLLSWLLARRITGPVSGLARAAEAIGQGDLGRPIVVRGPPEIRLLSATLEWMRGQVAGAQAAIVAEKARYANLLEAIDEAVITLDGAGAITSLNRSAERLLAVDRERGQGEPLTRWLRTADDEPLDSEQIPSSGVGRLAALTDGGAYTLEATRSTFHPDLSDTAAETVLVLRDVSDEAALHELKEQFLANVTHEFRTPLAALIASLELLRDEQESLTPAERAQLLDATQVGVRRLDSLVQNLLDGASLQAGYFRVDPEPARLPPLVDEAVSLMQPLVQKRAQTVSVLVPADLPPVLADGRRVVQVLVNLLSNASKFGPRGDTLVLEARREPEAVCILVSDHGPGIPARRRPRLFDRFLRPGEETVAEQGVGLGLAIVRAIVERHGGEVRVEPTAQGTTTFSVTLPLADGAAPALEDADEDPAG